MKDGTEKPQMFLERHTVSKSDLVRQLFPQADCTHEPCDLKLKIWQILQVHWCLGKEKKHLKVDRETVQA